MDPKGVCPEEEALHFIASEKDKDIFQKKFISEDKGYGVIATKNIDPGEFLLEYVGRHISGSEGEDLLKEFSAEDAAFLNFYNFQGQNFCIDGSKDTARLGRFINDDHVKPNSKTKIILDERQKPHLCVFAITEILAGEEIVYNYENLNCQWRQKTSSFSSNEHMEKKESRWKSSLEDLKSESGVMEIYGLEFNPYIKIANGCNGTEVFPGLFCNDAVAVKRFPKRIGKSQLKTANFLCSDRLKSKHLLQPLTVIEDTYLAYLVFPLCEYNLKDLIENKVFPERQNLTEQWRLGICEELLLGLQELHSHGMLHGDLKPENILFDINNKMCIGDFGANRNLDHGDTASFSQLGGNLSWASYEDVGVIKSKYNKDSDIQVAGCLMHYILTDGQHPFQTATPYFSDPIGLTLNIRTANFTLQCEERWSGLKDIITRMLSKSVEERPTIEESLKAVMCFLSHQSDNTATTSSTGLENQSQDGTHTTNYWPETSEEMDIGESNVSDLLDISDSNLLLSSPLIEEEFSDFETSIKKKGSRCLVLSDEEEDDDSQLKEDETTEHELILRKTHSIAEHNSHDSSSQQHEVTVKKSTKQHKFTVKKSTKQQKITVKKSTKQHKITVKKSTKQHKITVKTCSSTAHQRVYDKKNYCLYCEKPYSKLTRHLKQKHSDKTDVAKALAHRKGSKMQSMLFSKVVNMGNYQHNCSVLASGEGEIIPKRQATCEVAAENYLPCKFCFGMFVKRTLWKHLKDCKLKVKESAPVSRSVVRNSSMLLPMNISISIGLTEVLQEMTRDDITQLVKADSLILSLGERMFLKNGEVRQHRAEIRSKMRELARLVLVARQINKGIVFLRDLICPEKFNVVLQAVKQLTGFNELSNTFAVPSTALKLRHSLVKVSYILQGEALRQGDNDLKLKTEQFVKLIELEWSTHVSSNALKTLHQKKWNMPQILPLSEDIKKLQDHLKNLEIVCQKNLIEETTAKSWSELAQVTLTQLIVFNRRREGEVSRMKLNTYLQRSKHSMHDEVLESLSEFEKKLCENLTRVEIRGKRGRKVPVLFPLNIKESVDLLIKTREEVGISPTNPYIFARPYFGSQGNIRGCDTLRRFAESCGAEQPQNLTSTKLRKHIATVSQLLNLRNHELDQLATFMGHDIDVHREFYRLPEETLQMAKVSRLLFALQGGLSKFKGKSLDGVLPNISSEEEFSYSDSDVEPEGTSIKKSRKGTSEDVNCEESTASCKATGGVKKSTLPSSNTERSRKPWSETERKIIFHHFKDFLKNLKIPGKLECEKCLYNNQILKDNGRDWKAIKYFVYNKISAMKKSND